ncbi:MAG: ComF family protein [Patescibacteria group bacterium]|jgi:competence protein ComFC
MNFKNFILDLLFPVSCVNCGQENKTQTYLCNNCFKRLKFCGRNYNLNLEFIDEIIIAGDYDDQALMKLIKILKFNSIRSAGSILAKFLCLFWQGRAYFKNEDYIVVPIPLAKKREKQRGFNQAEIIAHDFANNFGYQLNCDLEKIKNTEAQSKLEEKKRVDNISGAFKWKGENLSGQNIILFDDVITTGATINEAAKVLKVAGAKYIIALAIAKG